MEEIKKENKEIDESIKDEKLKELLKDEKLMKKYKESLKQMEISKYVEVECAHSDSITPSHNMKK